ncbi:hypothetical protein FFLO_03892 [Filobasidium floriforme]|uniref:FAD-binding domain-containing protein n=1 Tax=Filobasidium floriforme TaxID=5210 RepID=A0A8K0NSR8_9TREE|nr:uncharacterized protein HD553DRAFT_326776 [Filobasidium floriforme]KAG7532084.1 hypothetical protein FFLO_03892 [Filobasidium floriforme]KAH8078584.1 hypothetical protein HD553DRAFT_326776 [Filobasidium floriforme]
MTVDTTSNQRLRVTIVGAGLCGLATGAAMREYADVTILESAAELGEIGAAVHLAPNAYRVIKNLGGDLLKYGSVPCKAYRCWSPEAKILIDAHFDPLKDEGCEWTLNHRADVQKELWRLATTEKGLGKPCEIRLNARVVDLDTSTGLVTLASGQTVEGDIIIGSDGIKSVVRAKTISASYNSAPSGHSAYRTLVPSHKIESNERLKALGLLEGRITVVDGGERRIICYPCRDGSLLNFVCCLPDSELNEISEEKWTAKGDVDSLVKSYETFDPVWQELLSQAEDIGLWQLRDQEPLDRWVNGRCILVGDGAHAMLPHQGQGASQAFEDAEALGYVLRSLTTSSSSSSASSPPSFEEVNAALQRVFSIRYKRATYIQQLSRAGGLGEMRRKGLSLANGEEAPPLNPMKQQEYTWGYWGAERWEAERKDWLA